MTEDHVAVLAGYLEGVVVDLSNFVKIVHPDSEGEIEYRAHVVAAQGFHHFLLSFELGGGAPNLLLIGTLDRVLEDVAALRAPVRMAVKNSHNSNRHVWPLQRLAPRC